MPLQIPTKEQIVQRISVRLLGQDIALTDFTTISVLRILIEEAIAEEFLELYDGLYLQFFDWLIQTAKGEALDRRLADYGLDRPAAATASGRIIVTVTTDVTIPAGTVVRTNPTDGSEPKRYRVDANPATTGGGWPITAVAGAGNVSIVAITAGAAGNTAVNTITVLENPITGVESITNDQPIISGTAVADDSSYREYFRDWLLGLKGGNRVALMRGILDYTNSDGVKPVHSAAIVEWGGQVLLDGSSSPVAAKIYIEEGTGTAASDLVDEIQTLVDGDDTEASPGLRAAGVPIEVLSANVLPINVDLTIDVSRSSNAQTVKAGVDDAIRTYLARLPVAGQLITGELQGQVVWAQLFREVVNVDGVLAAVFRSPLADRAVPIGFKAMPNDVTIGVVTIG